MNDLLGTLAGRYRLLEAIGKGGMGTVYTAIQEGLGRRVAIKVLEPRLAEDREQLERFRREAEVVASLGHPNIVQVTDFQYPEKDGDQPFLVMELLRGESLGSLLSREQVIDARRAAFIGAQVLSALVAAHRAGIVHRDIKPDNIFLLADAAVPDTVKVLDFGIAKLAVEGQAKLTGTGAMLGTPAFMAPEQARGESDVDARADVYAVGATLYQALSGRLPHEAPSIPALLFAIVEKMPPPLRELRPDIPLELSNVIERSMSKDRNGRFRDADAMRRALAPWSGLPASVPPPVSATAATIASNPNPPVASHDQATPIVVHHTPAVARAAESRANASTGGATRVMIFIAALLAIGGATTIGILWVCLRHEPTHDRVAEEAVASAMALGQTLAQSAATEVPNVAASPTQPPAAVSSQPKSPVVTNATATAIAQSTVAAQSLPADTSTIVAGSKSYSGTNARRNGGSFGDCPGCDSAAYFTAVDAKVADVAWCFKVSEHEPPIHEMADYVVHFDATGYTTLNQVSGTVTPHLDRCIQRVLFGIPITKPATTTKGSFEVFFWSPCAKGIPGGTKTVCD